MRFVDSHQTLYSFVLQPTTGLGSINFDSFVSCAMKYQDNNGKGFGVGKQPPGFDTGKQPPRPQPCANKNPKQCKKDDSCVLNADDSCSDSAASSLKELPWESEPVMNEPNSAAPHITKTPAVASAMLTGLVVIWFGTM